MKIIRHLILTTIFFGYIFALSEVKIGYVDSQQIITQFEGFRLVQIELEKEQKRLEADYVTLANQLDSLFQVYEKQKLLMSEDRRLEKENELTQKQRELQEFEMKNFGPQNSELVKLQNQLLKPVLKLFSDACDTIGKKRQFDYILDAGTGGILYSIEANNITEEVIEEMNEMAATSQ